MSQIADNTWHFGPIEETENQRAVRMVRELEESRGWPQTSVTVRDTAYVGSCTHCNGNHPGVCPRIKSIEYHENGTVKKVEYRG